MILTCCARIFKSRTFRWWSPILSSVFLSSGHVHFTYEKTGGYWSQLTYEKELFLHWRGACEWIYVSKHARLRSCLENVSLEVFFFFFWWGGYFILYSGKGFLPFLHPSISFVWFCSDFNPTIPKLRISL